MKNTYFLTALLLSLMVSGIYAQQNLNYQSPPASIQELVDAPLTPLVRMSPDQQWLLLLERPGFPDIEELAQPELRLAGLRINPNTHSNSRSGSYNGLSLKQIQTGKVYPIEGLPENPIIETAQWSPDGKKIAFTHTTPTGIELWVAHTDTHQAKRLTEAVLNGVIGMPFIWMPDSRYLLVKTRPKDQKVVPAESSIPTGPIVQETSGNKAPVRTYQDLLKNPHDEALFEYYATTQLASIDTESGGQQLLGAPAVYTSISPSPDGQYIFWGKIKRPFSYLVPYSRFPVLYEITDGKGRVVRQVADIPLSENIPKGFNATRTGPRNFTWRSDAAATLFWVEAQDGGDPAVEAAVRDRLYFLKAPFQGEPTPSVDLAWRYSGVDWGNDELAIVYEWWWATRKRVASRFTPDQADSKQVLFEWSSEDRYNDPGSFATTYNAFGRQVLMSDQNKNKLFLTGSGASDEGDRPFIRAFDLEKNTVEELWRSKAPYYEYPVSLLDMEAGTFISRRESKVEPPNYLLRRIGKEEGIALTEFPHPYPSLKGIEKQVIQYKRKDGVDLQGDLYLPKGYDPQKDGPLPTLLWAYPNEFKSASAAGQVEGSPFEFIRLSWGSPLYWLSRGYAILDDPGMPIIGEGDEQPNDTFREQLVANAEAAVNKLVEMGVAEPGRIGIGGHSYGAFMTANLLAHSELFAAGIARSGAYNRTLTPFGFQSEERTYWEAPEVYNDMSPFMHAEKINEPLLMIHGEADNNSGTFPIQSERLYAAIKGLGGTTRLVMLPHESHGYRARESILHTLWEMDQWLEKYVKKETEQKP
ncbi:MAG TPA: prolyl oligopeptidase family serine peptidase [Saprospiraceae bacterium]|nr:prolyl oligopeptidase family serine peptidase [Saprospiraceae bacterium]HMQ83961.1 prolyl oligopeptidase family serine peptidase [Saprospiraceae bacterium]